MTTVLKSLKGVLDVADKPTLEALKLRLQQPQARMLLHLHGGLVDEKAGLAIASRLGGGGPAGFTVPAGWEQVYIVWRTGAFEVVQNHWIELFESDRLYKVLLRKLIEFAASKVKVPGVGPLGRSAADVTGIDADKIDQRLRERPAGDPFPELNSRTLAPAPGGRSAVFVDQSESSLEVEFEDFIAGDPEFAEVLEALDKEINKNGQGRAGAQPNPDQTAEANALLPRLNASVRGELLVDRPTGQPGRMGLVSVAAFLLKHVTKIALRVIRRLRSDRDHGFYATVVEEMCRELYGDFIGATIWGDMKNDAASHFAPGGLGEQLLGAIPDNCRLMVTAHSAGSIWASHLLKAIAASGRKIELDLLLLAPAVRMDLFAEAVAQGGGAIGRCRVFTMCDELERQDAVLGHDKGYLYPSSLLYLVSGLFEEVGGLAMPDAPLVGLQRFLGGAQPWLTEPEQQQAVNTVVSFFQQPGHDIVYAKTLAGAPAGLQTQGDSHGAFDSEPETLASVSTFF